MSAQPTTTAPEQDVDRLAVELEAVADEHDQQAAAPRPATLAEVAALDADQREAWIRTTPAKDRWQALQAGRRPPVDHEWAGRAACDGADADLVELTSQEAAREYAVTLCAHCPVLAWCARDAAQHDAYGLWAGVVLRHGSPAREHGAGRVSLTEAAEWLVAHLEKHGPQLAPDVALAAAALGIKRHRLNTAADHLGIERRRGIPWELPSSAQREQPEQDRSPEQDDDEQDDDEQPCATGRPLSGPLPGLPIDPAARTASTGLLAPHRPVERQEQPEQDDDEQQQPAPTGRHPGRRGQRSQPRRPRPRSSRRGHRR